MTTPERLRRRQRIEAACLIVLGIGMVVQTAYFNHQQDAQRACFESKFSEFTRTAKLRSGLAEDESAVTRGVLQVYAKAAGIVKDDPTKPLPPADREQLQRDAVKALLEYDTVTREVDQQRQDNPVPPYPEGRCDQ